jgi:hypothetical protein
MRAGGRAGSRLMPRIALTGGWSCQSCWSRRPGHPDPRSSGRTPPPGAPTSRHRLQRSGSSRSSVSPCPTHGRAAIHRSAFLAASRVLRRAALGWDTARPGEPGPRRAAIRIAGAGRVARGVLARDLGGYRRANGAGPGFRSGCRRPWPLRWCPWAGSEITTSLLTLGAGALAGVSRTRCNVISAFTASGCCG